MFETTFTSNTTSPSQSHIVAARRGVKLFIALVEPVVFLEGHTGTGVHHTNKPAILRGYLRLNIIEPVKIKRLCIYFRGCMHMELPEVRHHRKRSLISSGITYFDHGDTARSYNAFGADFYHLSDEPSIATATVQDVEAAAQPFKGDRYPISETTVHSLTDSNAIKSRNEKSYPATGPRHGHDQLRLFPPGDYIYSFEFLVHSSLPESIRTDLSSVHYNMEAVVERSGFFQPTMTGTLDVPLVRVPGDNSLEHIEPITTSRIWRDQLCYDLFVSCKSRSIGSQIPMRLKLVALANLTCHSISVYMSELIQYRIQGPEARFLKLPSKKVLLFKKQAGLPSYSPYVGGSMRVVSGQGMKSTRDTQTPNLLGDLSEETEIELEVQLPRCPQMAQKEKREWLHFSVKGENLEVNHWIQIVLSVSNLDENDPNKSKPADLIVQSPFNILSCKATPANIYVPPYAEKSGTTMTILDSTECDCLSGPELLPTSPEQEIGTTIPNEQLGKSLCVNLQHSEEMAQSLGLQRSLSEVKEPPQVYLSNDTRRSA